MNQRKILFGVAVVVVLLASYFAFSSRRSEPGAVPGGVKAVDVVPGPRGVQGASSLVRDQSRPGAQGGEEARGHERQWLTPRIDRQMTEAEGALEVEVRRGGVALEGAEVRLYWRGERDPNTSQLDWRLAGLSRTDRAGKARLWSRAGSYLVAAQVEGAAPARALVVRPQGEQVTKLLLELKDGVVLEGRTQLKGSGEAVPLAQVTLEPIALLQGRRGMNAPTGAPPDERVFTTSDVRGNFTLQGLAQGLYSATARAAGQAKAVERRVLVPHTGELLLEMSGAAFLEGKVVDAAGAGVKDAQVVAAGRGGMQAVASQEGGAFSLEVSPGAWELSARHGTDASALNRTVFVAEGATERGLVLKLGVGCAIEGRVVGTGGAALGDAEVLVSPHDADGDSARAKTNDRGAFLVEGLPPGAWDVVARKPGYASDEHRGVAMLEGQRFPLTLTLRATGLVEGSVRDAQGNGLENARVTGGTGFGPAASSAETRSLPGGAYRLVGLQAGRTTLTAARDGVDLGVSQPVDIREGELAHVDFVLPGDGEVRGRVAKKGGALVTSGQVRAVRAGMGMAFIVGGSSDVSTPISDDATYTLRLPTGSYRLSATGAGMPLGRQSFSRELVIVEANRTVVHDLVVPDDEPEQNGFTLSVLEPGGAPAAGASVRMNSGDRGFRMAFNTDDSGRFTLPRARADLPDTFALKAQNGGRVGEAAVTEDMKEAVIQLRPAALVRGRLKGEPAPANFTVVLKVVGGDERFFLGDEQQLHFLGDAFELRDAPGTLVSLSITTSDGRTGFAQLQLGSGVASEVEVALSPAARITGRVLDDEQKPIPEAFLQLDGAPQLGTHPSTQDGSFEISAIPPGRHELTVFSAMRKRVTRDFTVEAGKLFQLGAIVLSLTRVDPGAIGIQVRGDSETVMVVAVFPGSPAEKAGVQPGDVIESVDFAPVTGADDARVRIKGAPGSTVVLGLRRNGNPTSIPVQRAP